MAKQAKQVESAIFADLEFGPHCAGVGGVQARVDFPNGYGASVIRTPYSYGGKEGKYEIAVLKAGKLCYDTPVTNDVIGWQDEADVTAILQQIAQLPQALS